MQTRAKQCKAEQSNAMRSIAMQSNAEQSKACHGLVELPAVENSGLLWVHPNPDGQIEIDTLLGPLAQEFPSFGMQNQVAVGQTTIEKALNWKLANDTFGETYHFGKLHKDTLGRLYYGNNLHFEIYNLHRSTVFTKVLCSERNLFKTLEQLMKQNVSPLGFSFVCLSSFLFC